MSIPQPDRFYTLSPNKVTGDRDHAHQVYEVLGVTATHALVRGILKRSVAVYKGFGTSATMVDVPNVPILLIIDEFDWSECDQQILAGAVETGSPMRWFEGAVS